MAIDIEIYSDSNEMFWFDMDNLLHCVDWMGLHLTLIHMELGRSDEFNRTAFCWIWINHIARTQESCTQRTLYNPSVRNAMRMCLLFLPSICGSSETDGEIWSMLETVVHDWHGLQTNHMSHRIIHLMIHWRIELESKPRGTSGRVRLGL